MPGYTKLPSSITESSLWVQPHYVLRVWIAMLSRCDVKGMVDATIPGFAHLCHVSVEDLEQALKFLSSPDPYAREVGHEGRRIGVHPTGWTIFNYERDQRQQQSKWGSAAAYMREYRRKKREEAQGVSPCHSPR